MEMIYLCIRINVKPERAEVKGRERKREAKLYIENSYSNTASILKESRKRPTLNPISGVFECAGASSDTGGCSETQKEMVICTKKIFVLRKLLRLASSCLATASR
jgi:hypothetical protein